MSKYLQFTGKEVIADILEKMPESQNILLAHGLSCVSCNINQYETLRQGILGHGFLETDFIRVLDDLNDAASEFKIPLTGMTKKNPEITDFAKQKISDFQKEQDKVGYGFKIEVLDATGDLSYFLDFLETPEKGDTIITSNEINLFLSPESLDYLYNCKIDFLETETESGFKIEKISK